jgi:hypothetical protein
MSDYYHRLLASNAVAELLRQGADLCVAPQNLVEFWVVATRPTASNGLGMSPPAVVAEIQRVRKVFHVLEGAPGMSETWERLVSKHFVLGKQAHDANLVCATILRMSGCNTDDCRAVKSLVDAWMGKNHPDVAASVFDVPERAYAICVRVLIPGKPKEKSFTITLPRIGGSLDRATTAEIEDWLSSLPFANSAGAASSG